MTLRWKNRQIAGRISYRDAIVAWYRANPLGTTTACWHATGAPKSVVVHVHAELVRAGRLQPLRHNGSTRRSA